MNCNKWQRARSSEQMEVREKEILSAAEKLFITGSYEKITMQMIARESGFSQSNLYRYFGTKEEIFLSLYLKDVRLWLEECLGIFKGEMEMEEFVHVWTEILCRQERLLALSPYLAISLEKNSSEEIYRRTKSVLGEMMEEGGNVIRESLPMLKRDDVYSFLLYHSALLSGLLPMTKYSPMQKKVLKEMDLSILLIDFRTFYKQSILTYLRGLTCGTDVIL